MGCGLQSGIHALSRIPKFTHPHLPSFVWWFSEARYQCLWHTWDFKSCIFCCLHTLTKLHVHAWNTTPASLFTVQQVYIHSFLLTISLDWYSLAAPCMSDVTRYYFSKRNPQITGGWSLHAGQCKSFSVFMCHDVCLSRYPGQFDCCFEMYNGLTDGSMSLKLPGWQDELTTSAWSVIGHRGQLVMS